MIKILLFLILLSVVFTACENEEKLPFENENLDFKSNEYSDEEHSLSYRYKLSRIFFIHKTISNLFDGNCPHRRVFVNGRCVRVVEWITINKTKF